MIRSYSVMLDLGIALGLVLVFFEARRINLSLDRLFDLAIVAMVGGLVGARLYFVMVNWPLFEDNLLGVFRVWEGGLVLHGAIIGGLLATAVYLKIRRMSFWAVTDIAMPAALIAQAVGRLGCILNGCCYGVPTDLPWGISLPLAVDDIPRHPTPLYEFFGDIVVFGVLWIFRKRKPFDGFVFSLYLILYSVVRLTVEFWRGDPAIEGTVLGLRFAQLVSIATIVVGLAALGYLAGRASKRDELADEEVIPQEQSAEEDA